MRIRLTVLIGALLLVSASLATAQEPPNPPSPYQPSASFLSGRAGQVDFGLRASSIDDDAARFQRFRDLRDGATLDSFRWAREEQTWIFNAEASNLGYRDQRLFAGFNKLGAVKASFEWDQVPTFYSDVTKSLFTYQGNGVFRVNDAIQQGIQGGSVSLITPSVLSQARQFDTRSRSDNALFNLVVTPSRDVDVTVKVRSKSRNGSLTGYGNFAPSPGGLAFELPTPVDDRTTDINASAEWANQQGRVSVGYVGSWYDNSIRSIQFENPLAFTDFFTTNPTTGARTYTSSLGQMASWPNSTAHSVNGAGSIKLPGKSKASAFVSVGTWKQNDALLAPTVNSLLAAPALERSTAEAEARIVATNFNFNTRPAKSLWLNAKYRFYDYDNRTPVFDIANFVPGDTSLGAAHETEPAGFRRHNLDVDASYTPISLVGFRVGYGHESADRTFRIFEKTAENVFRASADLTGTRYVTVRGLFEHSQRTGSGFDEALLEDVGEQPEMRHFDIADRDRNRGTVIVTVSPVEVFGLNASVAAGNDNYKNSGFGLRDNNHRVYSAGFDYAPTNQVNTNFTYGYEKYDSLQWSRTSNPLSATDQGFNDPRRDWGIDGGDRVRTVSASLMLTQLVPKTELSFNYDYSRSKATYLYEVNDQWLDLALLPVPTTGSGTVSRLPVELPAVQNRLSAFRTDARYFLTKNVAVGVVYLYEQYRVNDYALSPDTLNSIVPLTLSGGSSNTIFMNYVFRPYTANTVWARLTYLW
jgi:MtrB/PioB family decaheme-associated outer membrane protein